MGDEFLYRVPRISRLLLTFFTSWVASIALVAAVWAILQHLIFPYSPGTEGADAAFSTFWGIVAYSLVFMVYALYLPMFTAMTLVLGKKKIFLSKRGNPRSLGMRILIGLAIWFLAALTPHLAVLMFMGDTLFRALGNGLNVLLLASEAAAIVLTVSLNKAKAN